MGDHIDWRHDKNCYTCGQCRNWYESREDLEDHRRRRHTKYNCDQCDNWYESRGDLEDHKKRRHTKECEEKLMCKNERKQQKREEHRSRLVCYLCDEKFKNKSELEEHWEIDHEARVYECIHPECEEKYICQETWREHMKEKHGIGFYCEQCNWYCLFEEQLDEHMDFHVTEIEYEEDLEKHTEFEDVECNKKFEFEEQLEEPMDFHVMEIECEEDLEEHTEIECVQCNEKFESEDEISEHEDDGQECDQCGKWLCYGISLKRHKKKEHEITSEEGSKDEDMETHVTESECEECNKKFESVDKFIEHVNESECDQC